MRGRQANKMEGRWGRQADSKKFAALSNKLKLPIKDYAGTQITNCAEAYNFGM